MFKDWLVQEETHKNNIIKVDVFDFDDTLVFTPSAKKAKDILHKHNVKAAIEGTDMIRPLDGHCFYYAYQSLEPPLVPEPCPCSMLNQGVAQQFYASAGDPRRMTVILTGRPPHLEKHIRRILGDFKMEPNRLVTVPVTSSTLPKKIEVIARLLDEFPSTEEVEMWDDRGPLKAKLYNKPEENHISEFRKFLTTFNSYRGEKPIKFKINEVPPRDVTASQLFQQYATQVGKEQKERKEKAKEKKKKAKAKKAETKKTKPKAKSKK